MNLVRKQLILDFIAGRLSGLSYAQIEDAYNIESTSKKGDRARKWIRWYKNTGIHNGHYAPHEPLEVEEVLEEIGQVAETHEAIESTPSLVLRKKWQIQGKGGEVKWLESYENKASSDEDIKAFREQLINDIPSPKKQFKAKVDIYEAGVMAVISIPDFHIGREQDVLVNRDLFISTLSNLINKASHMPLESIVFVIGNDYFNSDFDYKTTKGTPQFDYQNWKETWIAGRDILIESIEILKTFGCRVGVINVPGNHDGNRMFMLGDYIQGYYRNDEQVFVDNTDKLVKAVTYGNVLLGLEHGEFKPTEYESILANEFPAQWGKSTYREFLCGHLHAETVKEYRGMKLRHLPSLAKESDWEKRQGYKHTKQSQLLVYSVDQLEAIYIE